MSEDDDKPITVTVDPRVFDDVADDPEALSLLLKLTELMKEAAVIAKNKEKELGKRLSEDEFNEIVQSLFAERGGEFDKVDIIPASEAPDDIVERLNSTKHIIN